MITFTLRVRNHTKMVEGINALQVSLRDWIDFWRDYAGPTFFGDIVGNMDSQGGSVGGWAALSPAYAAWKSRTYGDLPILQRTGRLYESFAAATQGGTGTADTIFEITETYGRMGTRVPYAKYHQEGTARMPARPPIWVDEPSEYLRLLDAWLAAKGQEAGFKMSGRGLSQGISPIGRRT